MEVLKISKPIVSAGKVVRSGRRVVLDEHDSSIKDKNTGKRIPVELTRGDVFEISAYHVLHISRSAEEASVDLPERSRGGRGNRARGAG